MVSVFGKPCMTDIYFGNGVWNPDQDQVRNEQLKGLKNLMEGSNPTIFNKQNEKPLYQWKVVYNPSYGTIDDIIETFWQLKESGQISEGYFGAVYAALTWEESGEFYNKLDDVIQHYNHDVSNMLTIYQESSFSQKHNVLLVAHSQGNLWGNKMYTLLSDEQKQKFRMISVGTPANHIMEPNQTAPYVTLYGDFIIRPIIGSLSANTNGGGHSFVSAYLGKIDARIKISAYVKTAYDNLMQTTSCGEYWAINMTLHTEGYMEVLGYLILGGRNTYASNSIGQVEFPTYTLEEERDQSGKLIKVCGLTPDKVKRWNDIDLCYTTQTDDTCEWKAGEIYSKATLEARKNLSYTMTSKDYTKCIDISHSGELYELTKDIFE